MSDVSHLREVGPEPARTADPPVNVRELLATVAERKWLILGGASIVALLALFWTLRQPKIFEAECTLEYDPTPPRPRSQRKIRGTNCSGLGHHADSDFMKPPCKTKPKHHLTYIFE